MPLWIKLFVRPISKFLLMWPMWLRKLLAQVFTFVFYDIFKFRKKVMFSNFEIAFPQMTESEKEKLARFTIFRLALDLQEFFMMPALDENWLKNRVVFEGEDNLQKAIAKNKGVLVLSLHLGNGDMSISAISLKKYNYYVISKKFKNKLLNDFWFGSRTSLGAKFIDTHAKNNAFEIFKALKSNGLVTFVLDQFMGKPYGINSKFFGKETGTAYGLAVFAKKTGAPVVPLYTRRDDNGITYVSFDPEVPLIMDEHLEHDEFVARQTQVYNDKIEEIIRRYPDQWMWIHRRWKTWE